MKFNFLNEWKIKKNYLKTCYKINNYFFNFNISAHNIIMNNYNCRVSKTIQKIKIFYICFFQSRIKAYDFVSILSNYNMINFKHIETVYMDDIIFKIDR